jgi:hypothetical protein
MTALDKFDRLESLGLWKETQSSQKKEVVVSFGKASLVLSHNDTPLTHWSLSAVEVSTADDVSVIYSPDKNGFETLEINDPTMNRAIAKVQKEIRKPRSHRGRIRLLSIGLIIISFCLLVTFWLPTALAQYTASAVTDAKAREIGATLMPHINQYAGQPCRTNTSSFVIRKLEDRLVSGNNTLFIANLGARYSTHLPGGIILTNRTLVEDFEGPEVLAGFVLMENALQKHDPALKKLFLSAGPIATISFLVSGNIEVDILAKFAKNQITAPLVMPKADALLSLFDKANVSSTPFAKALNNRDLQVNDPVTGPYEPLLTDPQWLSLQSICES